MDNGIDFMAEVWDEARVQQYIDDGIEESLNLDYKAAGALSKTDGKRKEITKDVSAMANSDGGIIVYGMTEQNHLPGNIDPVKRNDFSKEWLEHVIGNIRPKIDGLIIHPVPIGNSTTDVVYVVEIPKSHTAHQAQDKRYYKRFNFQSVMMDDYEIRDVMNRLQYPRIKLQFQLKRRMKNESHTLEAYALEISLVNDGNVYAEYVVAHIDVPRDIAYDRRFEHGFDFNRNGNPDEFRTYMRDNTVREVVDVGGSGNYTFPKYGPARYDPILPGLRMYVDEIVLLSSLHRKCSETDYLIRWEVNADNAPPRRGEIALRDIELVGFSEEPMAFGEFLSGIESAT